MSMTVDELKAAVVQLSREDQMRVYDALIRLREEIAPPSKIAAKGEPAAALNTDQPKPSL